MIEVKPTWLDDWDYTRAKIILGRWIYYEQNLADLYGYEKKLARSLFIRLSYLKQDELLELREYYTHRKKGSPPKSIKKIILRVGPYRQKPMRGDD
ncbi:hypothetical protein [Liquorilactobacillus hordei]|uniref:hypothetical protein n=1 Tax=Liquorilactobacillus hordei TaxID=468911 RepID=UPI001CBEF953|nr:hypothetical protein [Liquorilactobacillus hordei]MBZ2406136.1 hypothetical protein [Liquorilactobacillus hordei]